MMETSPAPLTQMSYTPTPSQQQFIQLQAGQPHYLNKQIDITEKVMWRQKKKKYLRLMERKIKMNTFAKNPTEPRNTPLWKHRTNLSRTQGAGIIPLIYLEACEPDNKIGRFWLELLVNYVNINSIDEILEIDYNTLDETIGMWITTPADQISIYRLLDGVYERRGQRNMNHLWPSQEKMEEDKQKKKVKENNKSAKRKNNDSGTNSPARREERKAKAILGEEIATLLMQFNATKKLE